MRREISAGIIIYRKTSEGPKFLLLYSRGRYWNFPKGQLGQNEKSFKAALREVWEETGIAPRDLHLNKWFRVQDRFTYTRGNEKIFKTVTFYLAETSKEEIKIKILPETHKGERHQGYGWFLYRDALRLINTPNLRRRLKQTYDFIRGKSIPGGQKNPSR